MKVDGAARGSTILASASGTGIDVSFTASALGLGTHHVSVDAKDLLGNQAAQLNWVFTVVNAEDHAAHDLDQRAGGFDQHA